MIFLFFQLISILKKVNRIKFCSMLGGQNEMIDDHLENQMNP